MDFFPIATRTVNGRVTREKELRKLKKNLLFNYLQ